MVKPIHRFGYANATYMERIMKNMRLQPDELKIICEIVCIACAICATSGMPIYRDKISTTHINSVFNQEVQADYIYAIIHGKIYDILHMIYAGKFDGERVIT